MRVLFDTNVILDVLLEREEFVDAAATLLALADNRRIDGIVCATTLTTIFYIAAKDFGRDRAREQVQGLLGVFDVAPVDGSVLDRALHSGFADYEDAVLHESARAVDAESIVTRNRADFAASEIPVLAPEELLAVIASSS